MVSGCNGAFLSPLSAASSHHFFSHLRAGTGLRRKITKQETYEGVIGSPILCWDSTGSQHTALGNGCCVSAIRHYPAAGDHAELDHCATWTPRKRKQQ